MESTDVDRVVSQVHQRIDPANAELGDEFYPAHLSVALIDAVFTPRLNYFSQMVPVIDRYCARFGLMPTPRYTPLWTSRIVKAGFRRFST